MFFKNDSTSELHALDKSHAVIRFTPEGKIIDANKNFLSVMGYALDEIKGRHHSTFVDPGYAGSPEYQGFWASLRKGQHSVAQYKRFAKGGKEVWIEASYNPVIDSTGKVAFVVKYATDITDQKLKTADHEGQIDAIGRSQAVIHFNLDGTVINANLNFLDVMGYSLEEIQGQHHSMFAAPDYAQSAAYKEFWTNLNKGQFQAGEYKRQGKNGKEVWILASYNPIFDMNGKPFKVVKYATDITGQKLKNADYEGQIDAIGKSQAVIHFNLDGTIIDANQNFLNTLGYSLGEIQGRHHSLFADEEYARSAEYKEFWAKLNKGLFQAGEFRRMAKGGREVWIVASYNPILDMNGKPFKVVKYATDITSQMSARVESARLTEGMRESVSSIAAAAEELTAAIGEIGHNMQNSNTSVSDIAQKIKVANDLMDSLRSTTVSMQSVVHLVDDIAGQVNLLALNATIEAARAGEAGKGFAVVASEVKNLANQVSKATEDISAKITILQQMSTQAAEASLSIKQATDSVSMSVNAVASAIEEQSVVTKDISNTMQKAAQDVDQLNGVIRRVANSG